MAKNSIGRIDERGRLIVPASFREMLNLKPNSNVLLLLDDENKTVSIVPFAAMGEELHHLRLEMADAPGTLSKILLLLAKEGADLIWSESASRMRGQSATYEALLDFTCCKKKPAMLEKLLLSQKLAKSVQIKKL
ncbi:hypothetical protein J4441_05065 [Candidatus Micrarchaeota archaeon]|nr:hypothetical protein [Candidatus Micrarchaeota archaeon]